jgi:hypothetical protein
MRFGLGRSGRLIMATLAAVGAGGAASPPAQAGGTVTVGITETIAS